MASYRAWRGAPNLSLGWLKLQYCEALGAPTQHRPGNQPVIYIRNRHDRDIRCSNRLADHSSHSGGKEESAHGISLRNAIID